MQHNGLSRRRFLGSAGGAMAGFGLAAGAAAQGPVQRMLRRSQTEDAAVGIDLGLKGNINHSICEWCFTADCSVDPMTLDQLCQLAVQLGVQSIELADVAKWETLKKYGLICAMSNSHGFARGFNDRANHEWATEIMKKSIDDTSAAGFPNVITFPGFRNDIPDDVGLENCVEGLKPVVQYAEQKNVTVCMEILNSRVDTEMKGHPGYMADTVDFCTEVCKRIASPRMKYLFDVYHVQIMQGDVITRIKETAEYIGHYHTAGNPGRNELDDTQEIHYPGVMNAVKETGFDGYVGHEFIPTRDPRQGIINAIQLCDV
jgi:hydroxypyruvate isomerase